MEIDKVGIDSGFDLGTMVERIAKASHSRRQEEYSTMQENGDLEHEAK